MRRHLEEVALHLAESVLADSNMRTALPQPDGVPFNAYRRAANIEDAFRPVREETSGVRAHSRQQNSSQVQTTTRLRSRVEVDEQNTSTTFREAWPRLRQVVVFATPPFWLAMAMMVLMGAGEVESIVIVQDHAAMHQTHGRSTSVLVRVTPKFQL